MQIIVLGLNHHTAPLAVRERLAFPPGSLSGALLELAGSNVVEEAALLSTCNRTELYCTTQDPQAAADWLARSRAVALPEIAPYLYSLNGDEAIRHVFRVASGLDSMVLGESQILGQLKDAVRLAEEAGTLGSVLHKLLQKSFGVAKDVRSNTELGANIVSMAAAAVHLASRIFEQMSDTKVLFVGAGEMIQLCAHHFTTAKPRQITIANRGVARAERLAQEIGAQVVTLDALADVLPQHDIIVSCTASPLPLIGRGMAERALRTRRYKPMVMVDLAVPRDIEPEVAKLSDIFLYAVDDLAQIVNSGRQSRQAAANEAEQIVTEQVAVFQHWLASRNTVPTIRQLREHAEQLRLAELERARRMLARGQDPQAVLEALSQGLTNKLLHAPTHYLNKATDHEIANAQATVRRMFQLEASNHSGKPLSTAGHSGSDS